MKPFDLKAAKNGATLIDRAGRPLKFVAHVPEARSGCRVVVMDTDGSVVSYSADTAEIYMTATPREGWIAIHKRGSSRVPGDFIWPTEAAARKGSDMATMVDCAKVVWEE